VPADVVTLRSALTQKPWDANAFVYAKGTADHRGDRREQIAEAVNAAEQSDVVILAREESAPEMTGEAAVAAHLGLPGRQTATPDIKLLPANGEAL